MLGNYVFEYFYVWKTLEKIIYLITGILPRQKSDQQVVNDCIKNGVL